MNGMQTSDDLKGGPKALAFDRLVRAGVIVDLAVSCPTAALSAPRLHTYY